MENNLQYVSLAQAKELGNRLKAGQAWVFNPYRGGDEGTRRPGMTAQERAVACHRAEEEARGNPAAHPQYWELCPLSVFANEEMVAFLISRGQFYYAPEHKWTVHAKIGQSHKAL